MSDNQLVDDSEHWEMESFGVFPEEDDASGPKERQSPKAGELLGQIESSLKEEEKRLFEKIIYHLEVRPGDPLYKLLEVLLLVRSALGEVPGELQETLDSLHALIPKISDDIGDKLDNAVGQIQALAPDIAELIARKVDISLQNESRQKLDTLAELRGKEALVPFNETLEQFGVELGKELHTIRTERTKLERERAKRRYGILPATLMCLTILAAAAAGGAGVAIYFGAI